MNIILFGANGEIGRSILQECLQDVDVNFVKTIGPISINVRDQKLIQFRHLDMWNCKRIESELRPFDVCIYCLGVSPVGMTEEKYTHITYTMTLSVANALVRLNPGMTFIYISDAGADTSERGSCMWARIKGQTENTLLSTPFKATFIFRPTGIQSFKGMESEVPLFDLISKPVLTFLRKLFPRHVISTRILSRAVLHVAKLGATKQILESDDIANLQLT